ncbi:ribosome silencing factor [Aureimonas flava]|uniref:ribosome silencing factor n=1 Tax=Aureimonas flava TaxID=2320271 RepID=UPI002478AAEF|nr:ribosome silencing factor [Aureimonas flava]
MRPAAELNDDVDTLSPEREAPLPDRPVVDLVTASLDDSKAEDVVSIDLRTKSALADHMVIASGRSHRHVSAVADHLLRDLKEAGYGNAKVEGLQNGDWVLIDAGDIIVHIFRPEVRSFYNIEKMWSVGEAGDTVVH